MAVLRRLMGFALAIGALGALLAPATPAAERDSGAPSEPPAAGSAQPSLAGDDPVASSDQDAVPVPKSGAGGPVPRSRGERLVARAAASSSVTISDYKFSPKTITVEVGDRVTWSNEGPMAHAATARNESFDTGLLQKRESGSATFEKPGTFAYICTPHPFMRGTVKVVAKGSSADSGGRDADAVAGASSGSGNAADGSASGASDSSGGGGGGGAAGAGAGGAGGAPGSDERLADTGVDSLLVAATGLGLLLCGLGLRLRPRRA